MNKSSVLFEQVWALHSPSATSMLYGSLSSPVQSCAPTKRMKAPFIYYSDLGNTANQECDKCKRRFSTSWSFHYLKSRGSISYSISLVIYLLYSTIKTWCFWVQNRIYPAESLQLARKENCLSWVIKSCYIKIFDILSSNMCELICV